MKLDDIIQLKPGEEILQIVHEDVIPHLPGFFILFIWFVVPFFFLFPLFREGFVGVLIFLALIASAAFMGYRTYKKWSHTVLVVTDRRVIDIEQRAFFDRVVTETPYRHIDEVSYRVRGFVPTIFRYGSIQLKLAGTAADIDFRRVRQPSKVHDLINDLCAAAKNDVRDDQEDQLRKLVQRMTPKEMRMMEDVVRKRERDDAVEEVFNTTE